MYSSTKASIDFPQELSISQRCF